jgi:dolichol kinase
MRLGAENEKERLLNSWTKSLFRLFIYLFFLQFNYSFSSITCFSFSDTISTVPGLL